MKRFDATRAVFLLLVLSCVGTESFSAQAPVTELHARHAAGQTILTWKEANPPVTQDAISVKELKRIRSGLDKEKKVRYRVYRSTKPIASLDGLAPIAEVRPLSCWNADYYGIYPKPKQMAPRYVVEDGGKPVPPGTGIYAHNPRKVGAAYYAVTVSVNGTENKALGDGNVLKTPVEETVGQGLPILQRVVKPKRFTYIQHPALRYYVRWEAPPNCSVPGRPFDYLVAIPPKRAKPAYAGIHLHCWGGSLNGGYAWWSDAENGAILIASNQIPYDWWTGYHERRWTDKPPRTKEDWQAGVVRPYSTTRLLSFLDWAAVKWKLDLRRTFVAGNSMGGSGAPMFAIRYPKRIAWARSWVGVHIPAQTPQFKGSYASVYGPPEYGVKFEDGTPVWDYYNDVWYLKKYPKKEIGFISFSNAKNDHAIGWPQAVAFFRALQETKRPHLFIWGQAGHGQRTVMPKNGSERVMPITIRTDLTLPAFTHCSLDNNPGSGDPKDGDPAGQSNRYLYWEAESAKDHKDSWALTVGLIQKAPQAECRVDLTPRRCQKFKAKPGEKFKWTNTSLGGNKPLQSGEAIADSLGLVTLKNITVTKHKNRIKISR